MHLKKVKLAGFKSFVDPTIVTLKSNRTAIVGPNGCGKSNIIDAVRWVMGESSAKQLRGEAMADVIFNGTAKRQPVGQASIELCFDNTNTMLMGEYAKYNEIAIRREINRDGMSNYYLNSTRCRRKDIVDIFLGTGLGPRSYAIIEQGMIAQLIESKPDDLRVFFEEVAGISKYKERRKETEKRIRHTRDNLARLNDIRAELEQQLRHLKRQANAAKRYKALKQEQRLLKAQLQALHWRTVHDQVSEQEINIKRQELALEAQMAAASKVVAEIEKLRQQQIAASDVFSAIQSRHYSLGADIAKIEQQRQHNKDRCVELSQDLLSLDKALQEIQHHVTNDNHHISELNTELTTLAQQEIADKKAQKESQEQLTSAEQKMHTWQTNWDKFNEQAAQTSKQAEVAQTSIKHFEQQRHNNHEQLTKLQQRQTELTDFSVLENEITVLAKEANTLKVKNATLTDTINANQASITQKRQQQEQATTTLNLMRHELQKLHGKQASLETLQQIALGKDDTNINTWLRENKLADKPRLAEDLQVAAGWEKAVEIILNTYLEAVCVDAIEPISPALEQIKNGSIALVESNAVVNNLLENIYAAETLKEALALRSTLKPYESVITKQGIWLGPDWACVNSTQDAKSGILQRKRELQELTKQINLNQKAITQKEQKLQQTQLNLDDLETKREQIQQQLTATTSTYTDISNQLTTKQMHLEHLCKHQTELAQGIAERQQNIADIEAQLTSIRNIWQQAEQSQLRDKKQRETLLTEREQCQHHLQLAREKHNHTKQTAGELTTRMEVIRNQLQHLQQTLTRSENQIISLSERKEKITSSMQNSESPLADLNQELQQALAKRLTIESELTAAKQKTDNAEHDLHTAEAKQKTLQNETQTIRNQLEQLRMEWQALQVRCTTYEEQITTSGHELPQLLTELPEDATFTAWEEKLENIIGKIKHLGPINLAAIDEYDQKATRKNYLDAQNDDLVEALQTLEQAIQKIDQETKERFKKTFNQVNNEFSRLFPIIFDGGKAMLEMTENDLLNTGIVIQAQPPGKRNSTIHLLSGGEKALTAIALVFAIFQLNPAPFCMLDEVDAPLDDNNIIRFSNLVTEMSNTVQFILVTHNKTTMELADQLLGVTMQEPGVSRMVSVDIQEAMTMAS